MDASVLHAEECCGCSDGEKIVTCPGACISESTNIQRLSKVCCFLFSGGDFGLWIIGSWICSMVDFSYVLRQHLVAEAQTSNNTKIQSSKHQKSKK